MATRSDVRELALGMRDALGLCAPDGPVLGAAVAFVAPKKLVAEYDARS